MFRWVKGGYWCEGGFLGGKWGLGDGLVGGLGGFCMV